MTEQYLEIIGDPYLTRDMKFFQLLGQLPLSLESWLEAMHQRKVLQRVGGGYHFLHKQLQKYLAKEQQKVLQG